MADDFVVDVVAVATEQVAFVAVDAATASVALVAFCPQGDFADGF
jgi:hypothetical protein